MTDPFQALRVPDGPVAPDPEFARALRARLERALLDAPSRLMDQEENVTTTDTRSTTRPLSAAALRLHTITPYLTVPDARAAVDFYVAAFGAVPRGEPIVMPDGRTGHVEVAIGDSVLMLADEFPELDLRGPAARGGPSQSLRLEVSDPDAVVERAVAAGGALDRPVSDSPYGRGGVVLDPAGHRWMVSREAPGGPRPGDLGYASLWTPDVTAAERFYTAVLGWTTVAGPEPRARQVTGLAMPLGMWGGEPRPGLFLCFTVPDVDEAVEVVRAAGGTAAEPADEPYGRIAQCTDDQGLGFAVFTPPGGGPGSAMRPGGHGDIDYYELRVPDEGRARAFYGAVLGWRFRPGQQPGYWHTELAGSHPLPMNGLVGGHPEPVVVPSFRVVELDAAAAAVRAAGGRSEEPRAEHGRMADCTDDQGMRFGLVER